MKLLDPSIILLCAFLASINTRTYARLESHDGMWPVDDQNLFPGDESQREIGGGEAVGPSKNLSKTVESGKESGATDFGGRRQQSTLVI